MNVNEVQDTAEVEVITFVLRVGLSFISVDNAKANLETEQLVQQPPGSAPGPGPAIAKWLAFEQAQAAADTVWE